MHFWARGGTCTEKGSMQRVVTLFDCQEWVDAHVVVWHWRFRANQLESFLLGYRTELQSESDTDTVKDSNLQKAASSPLQISLHKLIAILWISCLTSGWCHPSASSHSC